MSRYRTPLLFAGVALLFILTGLGQSWNLSLSILNTALLAAIMALGVNMQWGYAGLFSTGIMGSVALGGLAVVLAFNSMPKYTAERLLDHIAISLSGAEQAFRHSS